MQKMKWMAVFAVMIFLVGCASKASLQQAEGRAATADGRAVALEATAVALRTQLASSAASLAEVQATGTALATAYTRSQADLSKANKDHQHAEQQVASLQAELSKNICDQQITDMKYTNVLDASTILAAWWAKQPGVESVGTPYRDKIWSNALSGLHGITYTNSDDHQQYVEHFMVFFNEFGMKPGVFWIKGQCWLDPP